MIKVIHFFTISVCLSQNLNISNNKLDDLQNSLEIASRSSQKVFIEVFGGLT